MSIIQGNTYSKGSPHLGEATQFARRGDPSEVPAAVTERFRELEVSPDGVVSGSPLGGALSAKEEEKMRRRQREMIELKVAMEELKVALEPEYAHRVQEERERLRNVYTLSYGTCPITAQIKK